MHLLFLLFFALYVLDEKSIKINDNKRYTIHYSVHSHVKRLLIHATWQRVLHHDLLHSKVQPILQLRMIFGFSQRIEKSHATFRYSKNKDWRTKKVTCKIWTLFFDLFTDSRGIDDALTILWINHWLRHDHSLFELHFGLQSFLFIFLF